MVFMLQAMEILSRVDGYLAVPLDPRTLLVPVLFSSFEQDYSYWCGKSPGEPLIPLMVVHREWKALHIFQANAYPHSR